jgi:FG-GAP repeat
VVGDLNGDGKLDLATANSNSANVSVLLQTAPPAAVSVLKLTASLTARGVQLRWRTANETQTLGFNVYRRRHGEYVRLNPTLIRAAASRATAGRTYSWLDHSARGAGPGVRYQLQTVALDGARAWIAATSSR